MKRFAILAFATAAWLICAGSASAQCTKNIIVSWLLVSNTTEKDGKSTGTFGPKPL